MPVRVTKAMTVGNEKQLGLDALREKRWAEAADYLERALNGSPADVEIMNALAVAYSALGNGKAARTILGQAVRVSPEYPETYKNLAVLLAREGRVLEAADNACQAVELSPSNPENVRVLREVQELVRKLSHSTKKEKKLNRRVGGPTRTEINARLAKINSVIKRTQSISEQVPTLSLCMIVKNEEANLDSCLRSVKGIVNEIIIVDTGSTDRTPEIAQSHGAKVYYFPWTDNYAEARNKSLSYATGTWVLILDADEQLDKSAGQVILKAIKEPVADAFALLFHNYMSESQGPDMFIHRTCRLFRNKPEYRYEGRVHERIVPSIERSGGKMAYLDAVIHHFGYRPAVMLERCKHERYIRLLEADLAENPNDPYCLYNLASVYITKGNYKEALGYLKKAEEYITRSHEFAAATYSHMAHAFCELGSPEEAINALERAQNKGICHPELNFAKGNALLVLGRYAEAITEFVSAVQLGQSGGWIGDPGAFGYKAYFGIASACMGLQDYQKAAEYAELVVKENPGDAKAHELLTIAYLRLGKMAQAEKHGKEWLRLSPGDARAVIGFAQVLQASGQFKEARNLYVSLLDLDCETAELHFNLGVCAEALNELEDASRHFTRAIELQPDFVEAHTNLGRCHAKQGRISEALACFAHAVEIDPGYANAYFNAGDILYSAGRYEDAINVYQNGLMCYPNNPAAFLAIGNCYFRMGAYEAAIMGYRQALALRPNYPEAQANLSKALQHVKSSV
ncbi:MAG: tetratricopeptide repeat protein [Armatimonadota bacterium]|nr:tetratricopeptide repeat protein [Armatimonadota bacterium]